MDASTYILIARIFNTVFPLASIVLLGNIASLLIIPTVLAIVL